MRIVHADRLRFGQGGFFYKKQIDAAENFGFSTVVSAREAAPKRISLVDCVSGDLRVEPGVLSAAAGEASVAALRAAAADLKAGLIDAVVTAPICKGERAGRTVRLYRAYRIFSRTNSAAIR